LIIFVIVDVPQRWSVGTIKDATEAGSALSLRFNMTDYYCFPVSVGWNKATRGGVSDELEQYLPETLAYRAFLRVLRGEISLSIVNTRT
jgi:hypothetical protein